METPVTGTMAAPGLRAPASRAELFRAFNRLALQGFGGVLPVAHRELVERRRWLDADQFVELLALGQMLPGPNIINMAVILGDRWFGWRGALAACAGLLSFPLVIVVTLALLFQQVSSSPLALAALRGMGAIVAGLVISTALKLSKTLPNNPLGVPLGILFGAAALAMVGILRWPMLWVLLGLGPAAMALAYRRIRRADSAGRP